MRRFTLERDKWYGVTFIGDKFGTGYGHSYSPIKVFEVELLNTGKRTFKLHFFHANYPAGVNDKVYTLKTMERGKRFMLACSDDHNPKRIMYIEEMSKGWLHKHHGVELQEPRTAEEWLEMHT